ncbi:MAG: hypothetical protein CL609_11525 [Anaerolineaceae bacterium]|nr:hypothetical protein [Anaerolineaceae bacterium]
MKNRLENHILILDDDEQLAEMMADYLKIACQGNVKITHTEDNFWDAYSQNDYDIIFLDYRIAEETTGIEVLKKLSVRNNLIPVVMMTGEGNETVAVQAMQNGAFDYLVKGEYALSTLTNLVQKAIRFRKLQVENQESLDHIQYQSNLLDNMRDAVVVWDIEGNITYFNRTAEQLFGYDQKEFIGKPAEQTYWQLFSPAIQIDSNQIQTPIEVERQLKDKKNNPVWISSQITPLINKQQDITGFMDICRDITIRKKEQQTHNETRHFLERIITSSPDLVFVYNLEKTKITFINPNVKQLLGFSPQDIYDMGHNVMLELIHPDDLGFINEHLQRFQSKSFTASSIEFRVKDKTGVWHWFSSNDGVFARNRKNSVSEIICIAQNIDEKKKTEALLQQRLVTEKLLSSISNFFINLSAENTDIGIDKTFLLIGNFVRADFGAIYLLQNEQKFVHYCGFEKIKVKQDMNTIHKNQIPWLFNLLNKQNNLQIDNLDHLPNQAFKEKLFFDENGVKALIFVPMVYNNTLIGVIAFFRQSKEQSWVDNHTYMLQSFAEMTANALIQKRAEEALRDSEMRYRAIVDEHQTELIYRANADLCFTFVNETYCDYYRTDKQELLDTYCLSPVLNEDQAAVLQAIENCTVDEPVVKFECRVHLVNEIRWQEWTLKAIYSEGGLLREYQGVGRDITERKQMEDQIQSAQNHLAQNSRLSAIGQLASSVAHQISNPLTTIIAEAQLLTHNLVKDNENYESADLIIKAGWRAQYVIQELLMFSEPSKDTKEFLNVNETIQKAILLSEALIQANGKVELITNLQEPLPMIHGNLQQLEDLWITMLLLAKEGTKDGENHIIKIGTSPASDSSGVMIEISDNGIPFSENEIDEIFEPKLIPAGIGRGSGIELSICREIVRQHEGNISVINKNGFTIFNIYFPGELKAYGTN